MSTAVETTNLKVDTHKIHYNSVQHYNDYSWLKFLTHLVKSKICIRFLTDRELKQVIQRAGPNIGKKYPSDISDIDLPECYFWDEQQTAQFISASFPHLQDVFIQNRITGRKLIAVDANALVKMGIRDLAEIRDVTRMIRDLLDVPRPNMMRALMRLVPFESYLKKRLRTGKSYDTLNFERFCAQNRFPYQFLMSHNKNAAIPCTCTVSIYQYSSQESPPSSNDSSDDEHSLVNAPTVEFVTRNVIIRNKIVQLTIEEILHCICDHPAKRKCKYLANTMENILNQGFKTLNLTDENHSKERMEFANNVSHSLVEEMLRTATVLRDIQQTRLYIKKNVTQQMMNDMRTACAMFIQDILPITALLSLGQLTLESIFRQEPTFIKFVDEISYEAQQTTLDEILPEVEQVIREVVIGAEERTNAVVPEATFVIDSILQQAEQIVNDDPPQEIII